MGASARASRRAPCRRGGTGGGTCDHAFVKRFIILPRFGPAIVHLGCEKTITGFGSVRVSDSSAPQPPGTCAGRLLCCCSVKVQSPYASGQRSLALFLLGFAVGL